MDHRHSILNVRPTATLRNWRVNIGVSATFTAIVYLRSFDVETVICRTTRIDSKAIVLMIVYCGQFLEILIRIRSILTEYWKVEFRGLRRVAIQVGIQSGARFFMRLPWIWCLFDVFIYGCGSRSKRRTFRSLRSTRTSLKVTIIKKFRFSTAKPVDNVDTSYTHARQWCRLTRYLWFRSRISSVLRLFFFSQSTSLRTVHDGQRHAVYCMALAYKLLRSVP